MTEANHADGSAGRTVGSVASQLGVTVRALHHWDEIGLVRPSARTAAGYRLYTSGDLARIQRVLVYRDLGVSLDEIGRLLDVPGATTDSLREQRDRVRADAARALRIAEALDRLIAARESGILLNAEEQVAIFGEDWQPSWTGAAQQRWGDTEAWAQYAERCAARDSADWRRLTAQVRALEADLAAACRAGVAPGSAASGELAERHRASIGAYFDCAYEMHVCIGRTYTEEPGFAAYYDALEPGLADWLRKVIEANARAHGVDPVTANWDRLGTGLSRSRRS